MTTTESKPTTRRELCRRTLGSMLTFSVLEALCRDDAFAGEVRPVINKWVADLNALGQDLKDQKIPQIIWQHKVEDLFAQVELKELLKLVDFEKLTRGVKIPDNGAKSLGFRFPDVEGIPRQIVFGKQIFALKMDQRRSSSGPAKTHSDTDRMLPPITLRIETLQDYARE